MRPQTHLGVLREAKTRRRMCPAATASNQACAGVRDRGESGWRQPSSQRETSAMVELDEEGALRQIRRQCRELDKGGGNLGLGFVR